MQMLLIVSCFFYLTSFLCLSTELLTPIYLGNYELRSTFQYTQIPYFKDNPTSVYNCFTDCPYACVSILCLSVVSSFAWIQVFRQYSKSTTTSQWRCYYHGHILCRVTVLLTMMYVLVDEMTVYAQEGHTAQYKTTADQQ